MRVGRPNTSPHKRHASIPIAKPQRSRGTGQPADDLSTARGSSTANIIWLRQPVCVRLPPMDQQHAGQSWPQSLAVGQLSPATCHHQHQPKLGSTARSLCRADNHIRLTQRPQQGSRSPLCQQYFSVDHGPIAISYIDIASRCADEPQRIWNSRTARLVADRLAKQTHKTNGCAQRKHAKWLEVGCYANIVVYIAQSKTLNF